MKEETNDGIRGLIAIVVISVGFIVMVEMGYLNFLRNPNMPTGFSECQLTYGKTQCLELLDNETK